MAPPADDPNTDRPDKKAAWCRSLPAIVLALGLAGCGGGEDFETSQTEPVACPAVRVVQDLDRVVQFSPGGNDLTDVAARGLIYDFYGGCEYYDDSVVVELVVEIVAEMGPAATGQAAEMPFFVAVSDPTDAVINKRQFDSRIDFPDAVGRTGFAETIELTIPLDNLRDGQAYTVLLGFQLSPGQVQYNRRSS